MQDVYAYGMNSSTRLLRVTLAFTFVVTIFFAYVMLIDLGTFMDIYALQVLDPMHRYLVMIMGGTLLTLAIGMGLAFLQPVKYASIVLLIVLYHFARFIVDVVLLAQGALSVSILLPEMAYFLIISIALVRSFPVQEKNKNIPPAPEKAPPAPSAI